MSKTPENPDPSKLESPRDYPEDVPAPNGRELHAYRELLHVARTHGRFPTALECWPHVRHMTRCRKYQGCARTGAIADADPTLASPVLVMRAARSLIRRVTNYLGHADVVADKLVEVSDQAFRTALEVLSPDGAYDSDPQLLKAKAATALELLRICGHSKEQKGGNVNVQVNAKFGDEVPDDSDAMRKARERVYQERMGNRIAEHLDN